MTLQDIKAFVASVDPNARHYFSGIKGDNYTCWEETERRGFKADNQFAERCTDFVIMHFTKSEEAPIAEALDAALNANTLIAYKYETAKLFGTDYIRHLFTCSCL